MRVYWSESSIADTLGSDVSSASTSSLSYDIEDDSIVNGQTYYVRLSATDSADNEHTLGRDER